MGSHRRRLLRCERLEPRMLLDGSQILTPLVSSGALASTLVPDLAFEDAAGASWTSPSFIENTHGETWISGPTRKTGVGYDQGLPELDPTHVYAWYDAAHSDSVNGVGADADHDPISLLADLSGNGRDLELGTRGAGPFTAHLPALDPETTYFYRLLASNSAGNQWATDSQSFTTHAMPDVAINEFLASNQNGTYVDQDNRNSDWIEIYNPGPAEVDLFGWSLTDQADQLTKWSFPTQTLEGANSWWCLPRGMTAPWRGRNYTPISN